jgi:hypothetical protein
VRLDGENFSQKSPAMPTIHSTRSTSAANHARTCCRRDSDLLVIYRVMSKDSFLIFRVWKRWETLWAEISRARPRSRDATRQVSHNSEESVG